MQDPEFREFFLGHKFSAENLDDLRDVIRGIFSPLGYSPYITEGDVQGASLLHRICHKIFSTPFCIFDLSTSNANVYLELGIAVGFNRPIIALAKEGSTIPAILDTLSVLKYESLSDLKNKLLRFSEQYFPIRTDKLPNHCYFCDRLCESTSASLEGQQYLILNRSGLLYGKSAWNDLLSVLGPHLAEGWGMTPAFLEAALIRPLCEIRRKVLESQFAICHLGDLADDQSYMALGIAIGSRARWLLISRKDTYIPSDLQGFDRIEYTTLADFKKTHLGTFDRFLRVIHPEESDAVQFTTPIDTIPFWDDLENWVIKVEHAHQEYEPFQGNVRILQFMGKDQQEFREYIVPKNGLVFGRDPSCDVVLLHSHVSRSHFRILKTTNNRYRLEDLDSKHGTFLNGVRLAPRHKTEVSFGDVIMITGNRFRVWDARPVPHVRKPVKMIPGQTEPSSPLTIDYLDGVLPSHIRNIEKESRIRLFIDLPDTSKSFSLETYNFYKVQDVINEIILMKDLPEATYHFYSYDGRNIVDDQYTFRDAKVTNDVLLRLEPDRIENTLLHIQEYIFFCEHRMREDPGAVRLSIGELFGTVAELFATIYYDDYNVEPPHIQNLPPIICPQCGASLESTNQIGISREIAEYLMPLKTRVLKRY